MRTKQKIPNFSPFQNNLLAILVLLLFSLFIIPIIGFLDEGNHLQYSGVLDYIFNGLAMEDVLLLSILFVSIGLLVFNLLGMNAMLKKDILMRLIIAIIIVPVGIPASLMVYGMLIGS